MTSPKQTGITDQTASTMRSMQPASDDLASLTDWEDKMLRVNLAAVPDPKDPSGQQYLAGIADANSQIFDVITQTSGVVKGTTEGGAQAVKTLENADDQGQQFVNDDFRSVQE